MVVDKIMCIQFNLEMHVRIYQKKIYFESTFAPELVGLSFFKGYFVYFFSDFF